MYKVRTVFFSPTDTTKTIIREIAQQLDDNYEENNITTPDNRKRDFKFDENDVVIIGAPVYSGRIPEFIEDFFKTFEGKNTIVIPIVLYGNREYEDALLEMKDLFNNRGFITIAGGAFIGEHSYTSSVATNRPDAKDLAIAKKFGVEIKEKLLRLGLESENVNEIDIKGNYPYRPRNKTLPLGPKTLESCIACGICVEYCPTEAIAIENVKIINEDKCIRCFSCVKRCPSDSKYFDERLDHVKKWLEDNHSSVRKEPELFI